MSSILEKPATPSYQLRASKKYYENNKTVIKSKSLAKNFKKHADTILTEIDSLDNHNAIYNKLRQLATYKIYQIDKDARLEIRDRILLILQSFPMVNEDNLPYEFTFLRLGDSEIISPLGSIDNVEYKGRHYS
jgi:hypothetical protein